MAHKKAGSSSKNGRDSVGQRLGVKRGDGQLVTSGSIIVRQRGMTFLSGSGTGLGHDYTVFATTDGHVRFEHATRNKKRIRVLPVEASAPKGTAPAAAKAAPAREKAATPRAATTAAKAATATKAPAAKATAAKATAAKAKPTESAAPTATA
jgi:large subunit ribosomal protein L27